MSLPALSAVSGTFARRVMASGKVRRWLPRNFKRGEPVLQFFLNGFGKRTRYTFVNFPSLYSPGSAHACVYDVVLYDGGGNVVGTAAVEVPVGGTAEVFLPDIIAGPLPELGVLSAQIRSPRHFDYGDRHLGSFRSFFYAAYHDARMGSISVIHPQTSLFRAAPERCAWRSNMLLWPSRVKSFELLLMNPTPVEASSDLRLVAPDGSVVASSIQTLLPLGSRRVVWDAAAFRGSGYLNVATDALAAPNAKPLVFLNFDAGAFSAAHS